MRQASRMLDQSPYVNQLVCAVGGVLVFIAKSEWRGGEQKKLEKLEFDMPTTIACNNSSNFVTFGIINVLIKGLKLCLLIQS